MIRTLVPLLATAVLAPALPAQSRALRPMHTYSIVAMDSASGQIGVAVQSHWFSVGSVVTWAEPGVGAVATQSFVEPAYGPRALALIRSGVPAPDALAALLRADADSQVRQLAIIDATGRWPRTRVPGTSRRPGTGWERDTPSRRT